jgi:hypothetical protein
MLLDHDGVNAHGLGGTQHKAQVTSILHPLQDQQERRYRKWLQYLIELIEIKPRLGRADRNHAPV